MVWTKLFGEEDKIKLHSLKKEEFEEIVNFLNSGKFPLLFEYDKKERALIIWKPSSYKDPNFLTYRELILLIAGLKSRYLRERKK